MSETYYTCYAEKDDMTFVMRDTCGTENTTEVIAFYFGEPSQATTDEYVEKYKEQKQTSLKAIY